MIIVRVYFCLIVFSTLSCVVFADSVNLDWTGNFEKKISVYNLFSDVEDQVPNDGLVAYDIITPLFTDYAEKDRFLYLPDNAVIDYAEYESFSLPVGSVLVKSFSYPHDFRNPEKGRRIVETRLLFHTDKGWVGAAYLWNENHSEADLKVAGKQVPLEWIHYDGEARGTKYIVPNMNHCKACHRGYGETAPLGLTARQLNRTVERGGAMVNQLEEWTRLGVLRGLPKEGVPQLSQWDDPESGSLHERALGYFDINCSHCHNPAGLASSTRLDLRYEQRELTLRGVMHRPTAAGNASRGRYYAIVPGNPERSFLLHRLISTHPDVRMPEVGRTMQHDEGVALVSEWIESLEPLP